MYKILMHHKHVYTYRSNYFNRIVRGRDLARLIFSPSSDINNIAYDIAVQ